jgi:hypothetical protein
VAEYQHSLSGKMGEAERDLQRALDAFHKV